MKHTYTQTFNTVQVVTAIRVDYLDDDRTVWSEEVACVCSDLDKAEEAIGELIKGKQYINESGFDHFMITEEQIDNYDQKDWPWVRYTKEGKAFAASEVEQYKNLPFEWMGADR